MKTVLLFIVLVSVATCHPFAQQKKTRADSCLGKCSQGYVPSDPCQCNSQCATYGNCCSDYVEVCTSCINRCGQSLDQSYGCQCNDFCKNYNDCCQDYDVLCSGGDPGLTDQDLKDIAEKLISLDINNVADEVVIEYGSRSTSCGSDDNQANLFSSVNEAAVLAKATFSAFAKLLDNYNPDVRVVEDRTSEERSEENQFLDEVLQTEVMKATYEFMTTKGLFVGTIEDFKSLLTEIWFDNYDRDGTSADVAGSSGFEHVFIGEVKSKATSGFHNWFSFYQQEKQGRINYYGYLDKTDYGAGRGKGWSGVFTWDGNEKCYGSMPVGTSPELDLAIYTICFFARPEKKCNMSFNNLPLVITTFPLNYQGKSFVGTAYADWQ